MLEAGAGGSDAGDVSPQDTLQVSTTDTNGVIGQYYDQIAISVATAAGNYRLGVYDDSSTAPNNLLSQTADVAVPSGYTYTSLTEFALATTLTWVAHLVNNSSFRRHRTGGGVYTVGTGKFKTFSYAALPNPAGTGYTNNSGYKYTMKITHS